MLMAGLDGIRNQIDPGDGTDVDLFELPADELAKISTVPASLNGALEALDADKDYLLEGGVFTEDFISNWISMKYEEVQQLRQRPHPTSSRCTTTPDGSIPWWQKPLPPWFNRLHAPCRLGHIASVIQLSWESNSFPQEQFMVYIRLGGGAAPKAIAMMERARQSVQFDTNPLRDR